MPPAHQPTRRNWAVFASWRASRFVASAGVWGLKNWFLVVGGSFLAIKHV